MSNGIWGKLSGPMEIQLSSTVPGKTITKPRVRQQVWDFIEEHDLANFPRPVHKRIPNFKGAATAGQLFASLPEFKKACVVKVNPDKPQEEVRYQVLDHKKTLLVPTPRLKSGLFNILEVSGGSSKEEIRTLASRQGIDNNSKPVPLCYRAAIDIVVIGSVAVDKLGHRIGKGEGFADLEFALGVATGSITEETIVIATVHDCQVFDSLPEEIFGDHDITVDIIVTPTTIHRVENRLPKPTKVLWDQLSVEKFKKVPILKQWKEEEERREREKNMTEEERRILNDETRRKNSNDKKNRSRNNSSGKENSKQDSPVASDNNEKDVKIENKKNRNNKRYSNQNKDKLKSDSNQTDTNKMNGHKSDNETDNKNEVDNEKKKRNNRNNNKKENKSKSNDTSDDKNNNRRSKTSSNPKDEKEDIVYDDRPLLFVGNIPRNTRVRELKEVLTERDVRPKQLVWKGFKGFAFLYFDVSEDVEKIYETLAELKIGDKTLTVEKEKFSD